MSAPKNPTIDPVVAALQQIEQQERAELERLQKKVCQTIGNLLLVSMFN